MTYLARILVVDDNEMNRDMLSRRLGKQGYEIATVSSGRDAIETIGEIPPDLVLLDIMMPGIDGFEVLARIRKDHSPTDLPVIMATAKDEGSDIVKALEMGANDYVTKPFDFPVVRARVATQVQLKKSGEEIKASHARMAADLAAAARIQESLLPEKAPGVEGYEFNWRYRPCDELAGDGLNIHRLENGQVAFYLIDVCGHGVPAALLSVSVVHSLHPAPGPSSVIWKPGNGESGLELRSPGEVAQRLNAMYPIMENGGLYFTMVYGLLDPGSGSLRLTVAGHPHPIRVRSDGSGDEIGHANPPIGIVDEADFSDYECKLIEGDRILFYSDGLTEMFGEERLLEVLKDSRELPLPEVPEAVSDFVLGWSGLPKFEDDLSILLIQAG